MKITDSTESVFVLDHDDYCSRILGISGFQMFAGYVRDFCLNSALSVLKSLPRIDGAVH
ncbi:MAG: hypothetical protein M1511_15350 [Deltaproteobacteria bacterium]|nr:hypothetical protein [Deltaproteobacteria bacterium]